MTSRAPFSDGSASWATYAAALLLGGLLLRLLLTLILRRAFKSWRIGSLGWCSLRDIKWRNASGARISISSVSWACAGAGCGRGGGRSWFVLKVDGVNVWLPQRMLEGTPDAPRDTMSTFSPKRPSIVFTSFVPTALEPFIAQCSLAIKAPLLAVASIVGTALSALVAHVTVEIKVHVDVEHTLRVQGIVRAGGMVQLGTDPKLAAWIGLESLRIVEITKSSPLPALEIESLVELTISAPLDSAVGIEGLVKTRGGCLGLVKSSVAVDISFPQIKGGVHARAVELQHLLDTLRLVRGKSIPPTSSPFDSMAETSTSPLAYLRQLHVTLPLVVVSARYVTPVDVPSFRDSRSLPHSAAFALRVKDVQVIVDLGGTSDGPECVHRAYLGKGRDLAVQAKFGWDEIEGKVMVDGTELEVLASSAKAFSVGASSATVTSTWLPPSLAPLLGQESGARNDPNDAIVVSDIVAGHILSHASFETLDSALRVFASRPRSDRAPHRAPLPTRSIISNLPRVIGAITCIGLDIQIQGPTTGVSQTRSDDGDRFFEKWESRDSLCVSVPKFSVAWGGEYTERSLVRTDAERRLAYKMERAGPNRDVAADAQPLSGLEDVFGTVPPPLKTPVVRIVPVQPDVPIGTDPHSLDYVYRLSLTGNTLNAFILAPNTESHPDPFAWLDDKAALASDPLRFDVFAIGPVEMTASGKVRGNVAEGVAVLEVPSHRGEVNVVLQSIEVDLWRPQVVSCLRDFLLSFANAAASTDSRPSTIDGPTIHRPLVTMLPSDFCVYIAVASTDVRIAGSDAHSGVQTCRGVAAHGGSVVFEYLMQRSLRPSNVSLPNRELLDLREDIRVEANAVVTESPDVVQALVKVTASNFHIDPVDDARSTSGRTSRRSSETGLVEPTNDWELKNRANIGASPGRRGSILPVRVPTQSAGIVSLPDVAFRLRIVEAARTRLSGAVDEFIVAVDAPRVSLRVDLFHTYLGLLATSTIMNLLPRDSPVPATVTATPRRPSPLISTRLEVADLNAFVTLPQDVRLFAHAQRLRVKVSNALGVVVELDSFLLAGVSPTAPDKWDDVLRLRITRIAIAPSLHNAGLQDYTVSIASETARLRIPFRFVFAQIVDNMATLVKATKQLNHLLIKRQTGSVIEPLPEGPKQLPRIDIEVKMFAIELQDDPFETRLNIIWRAGYEEQMARQDRYDAFEAKVEAIRRHDAAVGEESDSEDEGERQRRRTKKFDGQHTISVDAALHDLKAYNSTHWVKRMRNAVAEQGRREEALTRRLYGPRHNSHRPDLLLPIDMLPISRASPLARVTLQDIRLAITRPSFPHEDLPNFLFDVGKGLPRDTAFTLLVPFHLAWKMEEARCQVRDYPLPLLHIPPMSPGGGHDFACWELETDFVVGEEVGGAESLRRVVCKVVPRHATPAGALPYSLEIPRTAMTVKSYATPVVTIRSPFTTRIGWGNSIQPAILSIAKVLDTLTKASPDPSERVGFWDKLRLQLHWRIQVLFQGEGPVHFHIKGTRDPYALTGFGAGFSKAWRGNVRVLVGLANQDQEFFQVESDEYILGIPNLRGYVDNAATGMAGDPTENDDRSTQHSTGTEGAAGRARFRQDADFIKVCAKFINGVRWGIGAVLERSCTNLDCRLPACRDRSAFHRVCRKFDFIPHWLVHTKTEDAPLGTDGHVVDSFAGFRSDFIHFSISLTSPLSLSLPSTVDSSPTDEAPREGLGYNSLHFSPQAATHFWAWWKLFDGSMSLPIRQGPLFPSAQAPAKKFGKHCATIKYRFSLAPLFISHTYRQDGWAEWSKGETTVVGLKGKIGRFNVDLHQREQEETVRKPELGSSKTVMRKVFYQAEVDCEGVDLRVISAVFREPEKQFVVPEDDEGLDEEGPSTVPQDYTVADEDLEWIDLDDFVDAVYTIPDDNPRMRVLPFINCPRFTYYRKIDVEKDGPVETDPEEAVSKTKFGKEPSHTCLMGCAKDTITVQIESAELRLAELENEARTPSAQSRNGTQAEIENRIRAIYRIIKRLVQLRDANSPPTPSQDTTSEPRTANDGAYARMPSTAGLETEDQADDAHLPHINSTLYQEWGGWENRYMVHNPTIQVNNTTRDVLLKYYYSSRERRGFVYHISASAIKFIRDLRKEHEKKHRRQWSRRKSTRTGGSRGKTAYEGAQHTNKLLDELIDSGGGSFWAANGSTDSNRRSFGDALDVDPETATDNLPESFDLQSGHLCMFIKPQIALQSDIDDKSTIILTAFRAQLKVFSVVDLRLPDDPVNAHVLHQTFGTLDGLQAFYPRKQNRRAEGRTGRAFVPLETLVDLRVEPWGFDRVVPRTSAAVRYDKFNRLRMSSAGASAVQGGIGQRAPLESHFQSGTDRVSVECDKFSVSANPDHFAAIFNVVTDLLLYSDPLQKSQNKTLEEVVFTHDFSDLAGVTDIVTGLQQRIRGLVDLGQQYQVHLDELDGDGRLELFIARAEFVRLSHELNLVMQAITRAQDSNGKVTNKSKAEGKTPGIQFEARASELVWHMLDESDTPFAKFSVNGVEFSWISKQDNSISNRLVIRDLSALNSGPDHVFAEIICKHEQSRDHEMAKANVFAAILWNALAPVGGISIVEQFELHLHPIRLQLEHSIGLKIMDYIFSQRRNKAVAIEDDPDKSAKSSRSSSLLAPPLSPSMNRSSESLLLSSRPASVRSGISSSFGAGTESGRGDSSALASFISSSTSLIGSGASRIRRANSSDILPTQHQEGALDADEMRLRASLNRTFILVDITATVLCLTYRSEKADRSPLPDIYNIVYNTPSIQYRSKTWSFLDLLDELKKDVIKSVWSQKSALIGQLLSSAHRKFPLADSRAAAKRSLTSTIKSRMSLKPRSRVASAGDELQTSPLRISIPNSERSISPVPSHVGSEDGAIVATSSLPDRPAAPKSIVRKAAVKLSPIMTDGIVR